MLADPQSVTVGGGAKSLPRTGIGSDTVDYTTADGAYRLRVQQKQNGKSRRTNISLIANKIAADPLTAVNSRLSALVSVNVTSPIDGFTVDELADQITGLSTLLTASSAATAKKILGGEK
jgi:hypothetical protein